MHHTGKTVEDVFGLGLKIGPSLRFVLPEATLNKFRRETSQYFLHTQFVHQKSIILNKFQAIFDFHGLSMAVSMHHQFPVSSAT
jgi:hypothetical protein